MQHAGNCKVDHDLIMDSVVAEAKEWRKIKAQASLPPPRRLRASKTQNPASMARNRQVPRRSGTAIGVTSEVILRATAWRHPQWHEVGSRGKIFCSAPAAPSAQGKQPGSSWCWTGGHLPRVAVLRGPLLLSSSTRLRRTILGPPDRGRVERLHNGLCRCCLLYTSPSPRD